MGDHIRIPSAVDLSFIYFLFFFFLPMRGGETDLLVVKKKKKKKKKKEHAQNLAAILSRDFSI